MSKDNFIFGIRTIIEAIESGKEIDKLLVKTGLQGETFQELKELIYERKIPYQMVPVEKLNRVTKKNHQGTIAFVSEVPYHNLDGIVPTLYEEGKLPFFLILDQVSDVRNFGAIARTAECSGVDAIIIPTKGAAQINADAVKTSAGALHHLKICRVENLRNTIKYLQASGITVVAATEKSEKLYHSVDYTGPIAIVMGAEDTGISNDILKVVDNHALIPILGKIGSLNVSVAAGVLLYEVVKQRAAGIV